MVKTPRVATSDEDIGRCFPVMHELRPHLIEAEFVGRVRRQQREGGYTLAYVEDAEDEVKSVAGFRLGEFLAWGKILYVDDLVTTASARSSGYGHGLMEWLVARARAAGCAQLHLDSGVQRFEAHRFYLRNRMDITAHHFALKWA